jgi:hypothetical protein
MVNRRPYKRAYPVKKASWHLCERVQQSLPTAPPRRFSRFIGRRGALRTREIGVVDPPTPFFLFPAGVCWGFPTIPAISFVASRSTCIYRLEDCLDHVRDRQRLRMCRRTQSLYSQLDHTSAIDCYVDAPSILISQWFSTVSSRREHGRESLCYVPRS